MEIEVVVEIPKGTRNKYEADEQGTIWLDRMLFTATRYPEDYGYVPETLAEDGDPARRHGPAGRADLPGVPRPCPTGRCVPDARRGGRRRQGPLRARQRPPVHVRIVELNDVPEYELQEIAHFFGIYKDLEPGKQTQLGGWADRETAEATIEEARSADSGDR